MTPHPRSRLAGDGCIALQIFETLQHADEMKEMLDAVVEPSTEIWPRCRRATLLSDRADGSRLVLLTEWETADDYAQFVRRAGLLWVERFCLGPVTHMLLRPAGAKPLNRPVLALRL